MSSQNTDNKLAFIPEESGASNAENASSNWRRDLFQLNIDTTMTTSQAKRSEPSAPLFGSVQSRQGSPVLKRSRRPVSGRCTPTSTRSGTQSPRYDSDSEDDDDATSPIGRRTPLSPFSASRSARRRLALSRTHSAESTNSEGGSRTPTGPISEPTSHPAQNVYETNGEWVSDQADRGDETTEHHTTSGTDFEENGPEAAARLEQERLRKVAKEESEELIIRLDLGSLQR